MIKYRGYSAECDSLKELLIAVNRLPETIEYIKVQEELTHFQPTSKQLNWSKGLVNKTKEIIKKALEEQDDFGYIDKFYLCSYYGEGGKNDPYYIKLVSNESRNFSLKMSAGDYGKLD